MDISLLFQVMLNTVMLGGIYVLIAVGLSLIYSIMGVIQFAHGHMYMLGAFVVFYLYGQWGFNYFLTLLIAMVTIGLLGTIIERLFFRAVRGQDLASIIIGLGVLLLLQGLALLAFGEPQKFVDSSITGVFSFWGVVLPKERVAIVGIAALLVVLLFLFIKQTRLGQAMRAVAQNPNAALLQGINVNRISTIGFALGSSLAAFAGGLLLPLVWVDPFVGGPVVIKSFLVIVLGGLGSIPGAVVGGYALGVIESFGFTFLGYATSVILFALVIIMLVVRPQGLFGRVY